MSENEEKSESVSKLTPNSKLEQTPITENKDSPTVEKVVIPETSSKKETPKKDEKPAYVPPVETIFKDQNFETIEPPPSGEKHVYKNCQIDSVKWKDITVEGNLVLSRCTIKTWSLERVIFKNNFFAPACSFIDEFILKEVIYQQYCKYERNHFHRKFLIRKSQFQWGLYINGSTLHTTSRFEDCEFWGHTKFDHIRAEQRFEATRCQFGKLPKKMPWFKTLFSNAHFDYIAIFQDCEFRFPTNFRRTHFKEEVKFIAPKFHDRITFENARFYDLLRIKELERYNQQAYMHLGGIQLEKVKINHQELASLLLCLHPIQYELYLKSIWEEKEEHKNNNDPATIAIAKKNYENAEDVRYEEASQTLAELNRAFHDTFDEAGEDWSYVTQKRLERKNLFSQKSFALGFWNWILDVSCRYGTSPLIVFRTAMISLAMFTTYFWMSPDKFGPTSDFPASHISNGEIVSIPFMEALIFSFQVFTSSELVPHIEPKPILNPWMMLESVIGYIIMMLLVITLSRKVIRS